jgi:muconolactone delta-isomerase
MKKLFMIEFDLPEILAEEFVARIPAQRAIVNTLLASGQIKSYSLALDRSRLWVLMLGESEFEVMETISRFPLIDYMEPFISELAFHNSEEQVMQFSLN